MQLADLVRESTRAVEVGRPPTEDSKLANDDLSARSLEKIEHVIPSMRDFFEHIGAPELRESHGHCSSHVASTRPGDDEGERIRATGPDSWHCGGDLDKSGFPYGSATLDGRGVSGRYLLFEVMLMKFVGPNLNLAPGAVRDDGLFDVVMVDERARGQLNEHLATWQEGALWPAAGLRTLRGRHLSIEWTGFPMHIDDKVWPAEDERSAQSPATIDLTIERGAIEFLVPKRLPEADLLR